MDNVLVTTGSEQALDLVGKAFVNPGDTVLVEQPTYLCALDVFRSYGAEFASVEMDEDGMKMDALEEYDEEEFEEEDEDFEDEEDFED